MNAIANLDLRHSGVITSEAFDRIAAAEQEKYDADIDAMFPWNFPHAPKDKSRLVETWSITMKEVRRSTWHNVLVYFGLRRETWRDFFESTTMELGSPYHQEGGIGYAT